MGNCGPSPCGDRAYAGTFLHGVTGSSGWVVQILGLQGSLSDGAPGAILFVVGLVVVFLTPFDIRAEK